MELAEIDIRRICQRKGYEILELNFQSDHIHMVLLVPQKISISILMGIEREPGDMNFLHKYEELSPKKMETSLITEQIILLVDKECDRMVRSWVDKMESTTDK